MQYPAEYLRPFKCSIRLDIKFDTRKYRISYVVSIRIPMIMDGPDICLDIRQLKCSIWLNIRYGKCSIRLNIRYCKCSIRLNIRYCKCSIRLDIKFDTRKYWISSINSDPYDYWWTGYHVRQDIFLDICSFLYSLTGWIKTSVFSHAGYLRADNRLDDRSDIKFSIWLIGYPDSSIVPGAIYPVNLMSGLILPIIHMNHMGKIKWGKNNRYI